MRPRSKTIEATDIPDLLQQANQNFAEASAKSFSQPFSPEDLSYVPKKSPSKSKPMKTVLTQILEEEDTSGSDGETETFTFKNAWKFEHSSFVIMGQREIDPQVKNRTI